MSRREDIDNSIWSDPDFHALTPSAKLMYVWSFTNPRCGMAGFYKVIPAAIAMETGVPRDDLAAVLDELRETRFVLYEGGVLWVRSRVKHLRTKTPQIAKSICRDLEQVGRGPLRDAFMDEYGDTAWAHLREGLLTLTRGSTDVHDFPDTYRENSDPHPTLTRPSPEGQGQGKGRVKGEQHGPSRAHARRLPDPDELPDDFPPELTPHVDRVVATLTEVAEAKGANAVHRGRIARLLAGRPKAPWLTELPSFADYWLYGAGRERPQRDVVQAWQNWVGKRGDLAAVERPAGAPKTLVGSGSMVEALNARPLA